MAAAFAASTYPPLKGWGSTDEQVRASYPEELYDDMMARHLL